jgi:hypothetical protein
MVAFLENTAPEHASFGCFNAVCNSTHLSQSFQIVQGKTQDYCRLSENIYRFVKNTLIYNTMSTNNCVHWPRNLTGINKLRSQNKYTTSSKSQLLLFKSRMVTLLSIQKASFELLIHPVLEEWAQKVREKSI